MCDIFDSCHIINHFKYYYTSPEIITLAVMYYVRFPLSLRQAEDILHERGINICHETIRYWWNKFGILFAKDIKKKLKAAGLYDINVVSNDSGENVYITDLGAFHKFTDPH